MALNIKKALQERNVTMAYLAEQLEVTPMAVGQMVNGNPTVRTLERIAQALNCDVTELFEVPPHVTTQCTCPHCGHRLQLNIELK